VVLFDEIEKAHPDVFNILLQVLDDGRLTDNKGRVADFKNTIIIMTSNIGSHIIQENYSKVSDFSDETIQELTRLDIMQLLRKTIRPEFLNRIDEILMFKPLSKKEIREIVLLQINHLKTLLEENNIEVKLTDYAIDALAEMGYDPQYGARPLKRIIQKHILNNLSKMILADKLTKDSEITIDVIDDEFVFYNQSGKEQMQDVSC
jgi:ATP-dependent Clp protease ATP-binding subunit ClpB